MRGFFEKHQIKMFGAVVVIFIAITYYVVQDKPDKSQQKFTCISIAAEDFADSHSFIMTYTKVVHWKDRGKARLYYAEPVGLIDLVVLEEKLSDMDVSVSIRTADGWELP
jgi:hypothetical protein